MFNSVLENKENRLQMKASSQFYPPNLGKLTCDPCPQAAGVNNSPGAACWGLTQHFRGLGTPTVLTSCY